MFDRDVPGVHEKVLFFPVLYLSVPKVLKESVSVNDRRDLVVIKRTCLVCMSQKVSFPRENCPHFCGRIIHKVMVESSTMSWENCPKSCSTAQSIS